MCIISRTSEKDDFVRYRGFKGFSGDKNNCTRQDVFKLFGGDKEFQELG